MVDLVSIIRDAAARHNVDPNMLLRIGQIESSLDPSLKNPRSSAGGLFQFIDKTWARYGGAGDRYDPLANADAGARFARDNIVALRRSLGRDPTPGEIYLAHQQGPEGAVHLITQPDAPAASLVGRDAVTLNAGQEGMTARDFARKWVDRFEQRSGSGSAGESAAAPAYETPAAPPRTPFQTDSELGDVFAGALAPLARAKKAPQKPRSLDLGRLFADLSPTLASRSM